jgi:iron complex outermembrane recepter protein
MFMKRHLICATSVLALMPGIAFAQATTPAQEAQADAPAVHQPTDQEIVVTASRVIKDGSKAPTPVTAVTGETLAQTAPSSIPDALNKLPVFANSSSATNGQSFSATLSQKGNFLNLRALGTQRLLTLLNGTRAVPTASSLGNGVDANMLPQMLVSRVDVVTGGASAVYGSDAVSGVVNYVLDEKFKGIKLDAQSGISNYGDDFSYKYGIAFGKAIGDRVHVIGSYEHYKSKGISSLSARSWAQDGGALTGGGVAASPFAIAPNATTDVMTYGGLIATGVLAGQRFLPNGTLVPFMNGLPTASSVTQIGGDGVKYTTSLASAIATDQAFLRTTFDVTDKLQFFVQGSYARSDSNYNTQSENNRPGTNRTITIYSDNAYLNPGVAAQMAAAGQSSFTMGRFFSDVPSMFTRSVTDYYSFQAGLKGEIGSKWHWDASYVQGRSLLNFLSSEFDSRKFFAALDAVKDPSTGSVVCRVTLTNPTFLPGCVPMNVMGSGNITDAAYSWARTASRLRTTNGMKFGNVNIAGELLHLPAGPVMVAVGGEYRQQTLDQTSNADPAMLATSAQRSAYFQDIRGVPSSTLAFLVVNQGVAHGTQTVKEAYGELAVPLLKDFVAAKELSLNFAVRVTDYKTSGTAATYKMGATWAPIDGIRFRAAQSRDIAAPSLYDLYAGANIQNLGVTDPLTNVTVVPQIVNQGNINLKPEVSNTTTLGTVITPRGVPGLTLSVDFYRIKINNAISTATPQSELSECAASNGTAPSCSLIIRPYPYSNTSAANAPTQIYVLPQNLSFLLTKGIDFEAGYTTALDRISSSLKGNLSLRAFVNYLANYKTQASPSQPILDRAGKTINGYSTAGLPHWRGLLTQTYSNDRVSVSFSERFTGSNYRGVTEVFAPGFDTISPNRTYVDVNLTYNVLERSRGQLFLNIQNLFNATPPVQQYGAAAGLNAPTDSSKYDVVGRYFTLGFRSKF